MTEDQEGILEYECPTCNKELRGSFGDNVHCTKCNKTFETDWDYVGEDYSIASWIVKEINI